MSDLAVFILKVLILSTGLSFLIKYGGRVLSIPATHEAALIAVLLPAVIVAIALWWRSSKRDSTI